MVVTLGNHIDGLAFLHFKQSINSDPFGILSSSNDFVSFCNWPGVTCSRCHRRVTALILEGHKLKGLISPHIGNLTFLTYIKLQNNSFFGEIPWKVGHLFRLQHLTLSNDMFGGRIPVSLMHCSELRIIALSGNWVAIRGFHYMRKVVGINGTFLKGQYRGVLLVAIAQDGNG
ncbi:hypothetical protein UlMin_026473 [Ulmus minor]